MGCSVPFHSALPLLRSYKERKIHRSVGVGGCSLKRTESFCRAGSGFEEGKVAQCTIVVVVVFSLFTLVTHFSGKSFCDSRAFQSGPRTENEDIIRLRRHRRSSFPVDPNTQGNHCHHYVDRKWDDSWVGAVCTWGSGTWNVILIIISVGRA